MAKLARQKRVRFEARDQDDGDRFEITKDEVLVRLARAASFGLSRPEEIGEIATLLAASESDPTGALAGGIEAVIVDAIMRASVAKIGEPGVDQYGLLRLGDVELIWSNTLDCLRWFCVDRAPSSWEDAVTVLRERVRRR